MQPDLFASELYPHAPGSKGRGGTSRQAAEQVKPKAQYLRDKVLACLKTHGPMTTREITAATLPDGWDFRDWYGSIQPRTSELSSTKRGNVPLITDSGERREEYGRNVIVWRAA